MTRRRTSEVVKEMNRLVPIVNRATAAQHIVTVEELDACQALRELSPEWRSLRLGGEITAPYYKADGDAAALIAYDDILDDLTARRAAWRETREDASNMAVVTGVGFLSRFAAATSRFPRQLWLGPRLILTLGVDIVEDRASLTADIGRYLDSLYAQAADDPAVFAQIRQLMDDERIRELGLRPDWHKDWDRWVLKHLPNPTSADLVRVPWWGNRDKFLHWVARAVNQRNVYYAQKVLLFADTDPACNTLYHLDPVLYWDLFVLVRGSVRPEGEI